MNDKRELENKLTKYSYQDCWNYALSLRNDITIQEVKNNIITLCRTVPERFWLNFSNKSLSFSDYRQVCHNLNRHLKENYPVPYLTGEVYFYGWLFYVRKGVFVPQKDTEVLVKKTLELVDKIWKKEEQVKVLDIGTGCGNLAISLAKHKLNWNFVAVDINEKSLKVAKINASLHQIKNIKFFRSNLFNNIKAEKKFDIIISNPPYISDAEYKNISLATKSQPKKALIAEEEGYSFYRKIFQQVHPFLAEKFLLAVEIGYQQAEKVIKIIIEHFPKVKVSTFSDYAGHPRVIVIYQSEKAR